MIYRLRKKFIKICILAFVTVFVILLVSITLLTSLQTNRRLDMLADIVSENGGRFPEFGDHGPDKNPGGMMDGINRESPFTTRFFTVQFDSQGQLLYADTKSVASVSDQQAVEMALQVQKKSGTRGWIDSFRYKVYRTEQGTAMVFVSGMDAMRSNQQFLWSACLVFGISSVVILILVIWISGRAVKPTAESYEKQKRFVTDANHELKTPLTLIRTNLDILESEVGPNEWLTDIREESKIMTGLVNQLVALARMDEEGQQLEKEGFSLSDAVADTVSMFAIHAQAAGKKLICEVPEGISYHGNEASIRQLVSILMDNAVKYCDAGGTIRVKLAGEKHPVLQVDNSYAAVGKTDLQKLFDRFYRVDQARTYGSGFGIGLSLAKSIVESHKGSICAVNVESHTIRFQVKL